MSTVIYMFRCFANCAYKAIGRSGVSNNFMAKKLFYEKQKGFKYLVSHPLVFYMNCCSI